MSRVKVFKRAQLKSTAIVTPIQEVGGMYPFYVLVSIEKFTNITYKNLTINAWKVSHNACALMSSFDIVYPWKIRIFLSFSSFVSTLDKESPRLFKVIKVVSSDPAKQPRKIFVCMFNHHGACRWINQWEIKKDYQYCSNNVSALAKQ